MALQPLSGMDGQMPTAVAAGIPRRDYLAGATQGLKP